ncbi:adenylate/guanylate cyclase domain-containing protein [Alteromonas flava]|uniref:adenylate/guanylate cyclase domain-containing protein n=1 Tax=Alteromonas flava TaxID=2048003 RepID=UPI000C2906D4|nr:adenylate/guanylate cyclase domain-containing protein [Alteromonas flava]
MLDTVRSLLRLQLSNREQIARSSALVKHLPAKSVFIMITLLVFVFQVVTAVHTDTVFPTLWLIHALFYLCTVLALLGYRFAALQDLRSHKFYLVTIVSAFAIVEWQILHTQFAFGIVTTLLLTANNCVLVALLSACCADQIRRAQHDIRGRRRQMSLTRQTNHTHIQSGAFKTTTLYQELQNIAVMFIDMSNFCDLVNQRNAAEQHALLHQFYCEFDRLVNSYGLYRIKTNGDEYIVASGLACIGSQTDQKALEQQNALALCLCALAIRAYFNQAITEYTDRCHLRIGIATGEVVAGRIGRKMLGYDLWGKPMLLASRLEHSCIPNQIQICPVTYQQVKAQLLTSRRGPQALKGLGIVTCYWLLSDSHAQAKRLDGVVAANIKSLC